MMHPAVQEFVRSVLANPCTCIPERNFPVLEGPLEQEIQRCLVDMKCDATITYMDHKFVKIRVDKNKRFLGSFWTNGSDQASFEPAKQCLSCGLNLV
jgi:hypothetical protein